MGDLRDFPFKLFTFLPLRHGGNCRIVVECLKPEDGLKYVSPLVGAKWDGMLKRWHVPDNKTYREPFECDISWNVV